MQMAEVGEAMTGTTTVTESKTLTPSVMTGLKTLTGVLLLAALCAAQVKDGDPKRSRGGWWGDLLEERTVALQQILDKPAPLRGQTVSFVVQVHRPGRIDNPFHTKFEPDLYLNLQGWGAEAELWLKDIYAAPFKHLFVKRGSDVERTIGKAAEYTRWVVTGQVAEIVKGAPWIEIVGARKLASQIDEPSLVNVVKGFMLRDLKRWDACASAFHAADHTALPRKVRAMIAREEAHALHRAGKTTLAHDRLQATARVIGEDKKTAEALKLYRGMLGLPDPEPDTPPANGKVATPSPAKTAAETRSGS